MADVGVFVTKVASWEVVGEDGRKRHRGDLQPLLDISRTHQLPDRLLQLPKRVGEAYWIRHPHSPFGLAVTRILHLRYRSPAKQARATESTRSSWPPALQASWESGAVGTGASRSLEAHSTRVSWEFIGSSSPTATVEGARRPLQTACTTA